MQLPVLIPETETLLDPFSKLYLFLNYLISLYCKRAGNKLSWKKAGEQVHARKEGESIFNGEDSFICTAISYDLCSSWNYLYTNNIVKYCMYSGK